jgi:hypothetical protein
MPYSRSGWEEHAGYDCCSPGVEIYKDGKRVFVLDAADFGWGAYGLGNEVVKHREVVRAAVLAEADFIVQACNNALDLEQSALDKYLEMVDAPQE